METVYDWITVVIFAGLVTHFLKQSAERGARQTPLWQYAIGAGGCALGNWLGDSGRTLAAIAVIALTLAGVAYVGFARPGLPRDH